ncbi:MAG: hypothetical protein RLZZ528_358 [Pseudomonadota bacterium]
MSRTEPGRTSYRVADLAARKPTRFSLSPDPAMRAGLARDLSILGVDGLSFRGEIRPIGRHDWELRAELSARVVQACIVTLEPVTTAIREDVVRRYLHDLPEPDAEETEMPEDDTVEPLPEVIDLLTVLTEALALALPLYPRAEGADAALPAAEPVEKPFAGLADLLRGKGETPSGTDL